MPSARLSSGFCIWNAEPVPGGNFKSYGLQFCHYGMQVIHAHNKQSPFLFGHAFLNPLHHELFSLLLNCKPVFWKREGRPQGIKINVPRRIVFRCAWSSHVAPLK